VHPAAAAAAYMGMTGFMQMELRCKQVAIHKWAPEQKQQSYAGCHDLAECSHGCGHSRSDDTERISFTALPYPALNIHTKRPASTGTELP